MGKAVLGIAMSRMSALGLGAVLLVAGCGGGSPDKTYEGTGPSLVGPFTVPDNWQLRYDFTGQMLRITVMNEDGGRAGTVNRQGTGVGVSVYPEGGIYSLEIQTDDFSTWKITVPRAP